MPMKQSILGVLIEDSDGTQVQHDVKIMQGDKLRAELEAPRHGLVDLANQGMHLMTLWAWAALARTHVIDEDFATFRDRCVDIEPDPDDSEVPPTQPAEGSTPTSPSPTTGPASTGSTPNATSPESTESA